MYRQIIAASALLLGAATTVYAAPSSTGLETRNASPQCWYGSDFPAQSDWLSFDSLFEKWRSQFQQQGDTDHELSIMKSALKSYSSQAGVDAAFTTAMMIQESAGNTCRKCGDSGMSCGLLQVRGAPKDCDSKAHPCADGSIQKAIQCGTVGCGVEGSNIKTCVASQGQKWGEVLRCYNTGSVTDKTNLRAASTGDPRYVHMIANILLGADYAVLGDLGGAKCGF
ncbi:hypothetical protein F4821DRAFT_23413 [Hypoxylon rubiginosum]|uniref:Uncharacterized protein n=1 Tax=Hypoxylon rubiginosum TaxID=110542 RepID=A0ACC0CMZ2_9PEZI|nr:hypothetical protein F4821DRAFT_23413 [Hypoxylon rubiginosum]